MEHLLELAKARRLDRAGATYAVVAWLLVQAASIALPAFDAPGAALRWLIVLLVAGFPLTLLATWFIAERRQPDLHPVRGRDLLLFGLMGLVAVLVVVQLALGFSWYRKGASKQGSPAEASSIAVLPFANLSGDATKAYFSDGIADQLIGELAQVPSLRVAARTSSFAFRDKNIDIKTIAHALDVRSILEGSVREEGNRVRITAELVDASNGFQIWSQSYDRKLADILTLQDEIARSITGALSERLWGRRANIAQLALRHRSINPEAYKTYLQGQFYFAQRTREGVAKAIGLFRHAARLAPDYADAFAALGYAEATNALDFQLYQDVPPALDAVMEALRLDPDNATALVASATTAVPQWRWSAADNALRHLDRLHVNSADAWRMRAIFYDYLGLAQYAGPSEEKAVQLNPLSFIDHYNLALYRMVQKHFDEAARVGGDAWALQPGNPDLQVLKCEIAIGKKDLPEARRILAQLTAQTAQVAGFAAACNFYINIATKNYPAAHKVAEAVAASYPAAGISATDIGTAYAMTNDIDNAMKWFRKALDIREPQLPRVSYASPELTKLFADPRWKDLRNESAIRDWESARAEVVASLKRTNS